ncbi:MAG: hypothetical protein ABI779_15480 [Acidobacteriota bacterium]
MIAPTLLLAAILAAVTPPAPATTVPPVVRTIRIPGNDIPTEISQHAGALWFVSWHNWPKVEPFLGRISVKGTIRMNEIMGGSMPGLSTRTGDGSLWLTDRKRAALWHVLPNNRIIRVKTDRTTLGIAAGSDGNLWTTHPDSSAISKYGLDGVMHGRWKVPALRGMSPRPNWIAAGPDGALWFSDTATDRIGRITTEGALTMFPLPRGWKDPGEIVATRDALWFTVGNRPILGKLTVKGVFKPVPIREIARSLAAGSEERMWYASGGRAIGWVNADGSNDYVLVAEENGGVRALASGPDGAMWFVDEGARTVGRVEMPAATP